MAGIIFLLVLVLILIQVPAVQNFVKNKAVSYLQDKIKTKVEIGKLSIDFPKQIVLEKVYFEDQQKDTLLAGEKIRLDISLFKLLSNTVEVNYISLDGIRANIYRKGTDTSFNFDYIIKAFASEEKKPVVKDTTAVMKFKIGKIELNKILTTYKDDVTGNEIYFYLGKFETRIDKFDPDHAEYVIPAISVADITTRIKQYRPLIESKPAVQVEAESNKPIQTKLDLGTLNLKNINLNYTNDISVLSAQLNLGELITAFGKMDLAKLFIPLKKLQLKNTFVKVVIGKSAASAVVAKEIEKHAVAQANNPWQIAVNNVSFSNNEIQFDNDNNPVLKKGMDYSHMHIKDLMVNADSLNFTPAIYKGNIQQIAFNEKSGFNLQRLQTNFFYSDKETKLQNLLLQTDKTVLRDHILLQYQSISTIADKPGEIFIDANLNQCKIAVKDVLVFAPMLAVNLKGNEQAIFALNGSAKGFVKDITIPNFELSGLGTTAVQLSGNIKGLPEAKNAWYNLQLTKFVTTKKDIENLAPRNSIPSTIRIPERLSAKGFFKGTMKDLTAKLSTQTTNGNADITGSISNSGKSYTAKILVNKLDLGYLLKQEDNLGRISLEANANGSGLDYKTMTATLHAKLLEGEIKKYIYKNLYLDASVAKGNAVVESSIKDQYISYLLKATANLSNKYPALQMKLQLDTLNLLALHLLADSLQLSGTLNADFANTDPDALQGNLKIYNLALNSNNKNISTDTITLVAANSKDSGERINLHAEMADIDWNGDYKLTEVAKALQHTINRYYNIPGFKDTLFTAQQWQMNVHFRPSPLVLQLMPELKGTDTVGAKISFNSEQNNLDLSITAPKIQYGEQAIEQLSVTASSDDKQLNYKLNVNKAGSKSVQLYKTSLTGNVANNILNTSLLVKDKKETNRYQFAATLNQVSGRIRFALKPDSLLLDYEKWQVSNDNFLQYDSTGVIANNFLLSNKDQSLRINSATTSTQAPLEVAFKNFSIHTLTSFAEQDSLFMDGIIDGNAIVKNATANPVFTSDLQIKNFTYKKDTVGNISVKVDNETANAFNANVKIEGNGNDVQLAGKYYTGESKMDLQLNIGSLNLATVKPFASTQLKDAGGNLKGNITIAGTLDKPAVNGDVHFENAFIVPTVLGERFTLPNEKITISSKGINFNKFTLVDSAGNKAIINGDVLTTDFKNYKFAIDLNADDFSLINSTQADNSLFYGKFNTDARIKLSGDMQAPVIDANIRVNKSTAFTLILPTDNPEVQERQGVVNFIDMDAPKDTLHKIDLTDTLINTAALAGMNLSAIIETDTAALFTLVIDERTGDALNLKGKADLAAGIDESGKLSLTGNYEIEKGSYQLSFNFLKRKFDIQKGSVITWTGDPTSATVDIAALYEVKASPIDLVEAQLSTADLIRYKQRIPIQVFLKMKGELLKPQITFDIVLPASEVSQWPVVDGRLTQLRTDESELNKQVFALLLLNRFVGEDITKSAAGSTTTATLVRQSVSSILADQLNKIAGSLIKGVDVNFGINSEDDYTTGAQQTRTDLTVGVSKSLLNDRIKVSVGSNFALEGTTNTNQAASTIAGDVSVDYQVSKDGRYMLRAYRKNNYEGVIEGQVIETGLTFIFTLEYDQLKELFKKKDQALKEDRKKEKQERKQEKQASENN